MHKSPKTFYAPAERATEKKLAEEIGIVSENPVLTGLLHSISGLLAVLDEHRQILAINDSLLQMLGIDDPSKALGLRPGEALQCIRAHDEPSGCGTTKYCSTCGAAIAIVSSLGQDKPVERICALSANRNGEEIEIALLVRSHPITIENNRFLLLFLQDITRQQQRAALERTFFHDINNMLHMLVGVSEMLLDEKNSALAENIHQVTLRLQKEIAIQQCLFKNDELHIQPARHEIRVGKILEELKTFFANHPIAHGKKIEFQEDYPDIAVITDSALVSRVLCNMVLNAVEATGEEGVVKIWVEQEGRSLSFCVWNAWEIPPEIANRVFQRNFSTKEQAGRGIGTFSMKLFGEKVLGGKVAFTSSREGGTVFRFFLPV